MSPLLSVAQSAWFGSRNLGSFVAVEEDVDRRIQLAYVSFRKLEARMSLKLFGYSYIELVLNLCFPISVAHGHFLLLKPIV